MIRGSTVLTVALLVLVSGCGRHPATRPEERAQARTQGALVGNPDPRLIRLMLRASVLEAGRKAPPAQPLAISR